MITDKTLPLVTVYMPTYNRFELLQRAVDSVLKQDYRNIELIVVDDNSTDGTHEYLAKMADKDPRFRYFINEKNSGACVSRNKAIFEAHGKFITGLDDDDYFLHHHVSSLINAWKTKPNECIAIYPSAYVIKKNKLAKAPKRVFRCEASNLITYNWIGNQIFTKTSYLKHIKGFDVKLPAWQDIECWYRLLNSHNMYAYSSCSYSYVIDLSHPHERITTSKAGEVEKAYNIFCNKYQLNNLEKEVLKLQLNPYLARRSKVIDILKILIYQPNIPNLALVAKRAVISIIRR